MSDHEIAGIIDDLKRGYDGDAWHGPSLRKVLAGVTAEAASARPISGGHSIWEIVAHLAAWDDVVSRRIAESAADRGAGQWRFSARDRYGRRRLERCVVGVASPALATCRDRFGAG